MTYRKGSDFLYFIVPVILSKYSNVKFYIFGDGEKQPLLENLVEEMNFNDRVIFSKEYVDMNKIPETLAEHDILISTSLTESFCLLILEAIATGLYVISTGQNLFFLIYKSHQN